MVFPSFKKELECIRQGYAIVVGCDEAGRGPIAGPVVAAACILDPETIGSRRSKNTWYARVRDSKTVPEAEREFLAHVIKARAKAWGIGIVWQGEIDAINIHHATLKAMRQAVESLCNKIGSAEKMIVLVDGKFGIPDLSCEQESIVRGDAHTLSIAAASLIAKVERDAIMQKLHKEFPMYGFDRHKGYNTPEHQRALREFGMASVHRKSFVKI